MSTHVNNMLSPTAGRALLQMTRAAIDEWIHGRLFSPAAETHPELTQRFGLFVTLWTDHALRGCIGKLTSDTPLFTLAPSLAVSAASEDPRFPPLTKKEWPNVRIEVSVVSPMKRMENVDELTIGTHGVLVKKSGQSGVYLPEVAVSMGWLKEEFVRRTAEEKAGLLPGEWRDAEIYLFTTQVFEEA